MPTDILSAPAPVRLPLSGDGPQRFFPVREIYCVGRNYADHAIEMGHDPDRDPPFFFRKDRAHVHVGDGTIPYPPATQDVHHEVELVVALGQGGHDLSPDAARAAILGHAVGIDLTRRDLQAEAKALRRPWDLSKGFANAALVGPLVHVDQGAPDPDAAILLDVDGETRQSGRLDQMIWPVAETLSALSRLVELHPGDLIFTGTPAGVGPGAPGQTMQARIEGLPPLTVMLDGAP